MSEEMNNKIRLSQARVASSKKSKKSEKQTKDDNQKNRLQKSVSPVVAAKKAKNVATAFTAVQPMDIAIYGMAFSLAALKDILDLAVGIIPGVVTVIGLCVSIAIGFLLLFDGVSSSQRKVVKKMTKRYLVLIGGTIVESFGFGLNYIPFEMLTVAIIYWMSLVDRKAR